MSTLPELMFAPMPDEFTAAQQRNWVTYTLLPQDSPTLAEEPTLKLLENRSVISGAGTTGLRTWEAALHLASYLLSSQSIASVRGKRVIELGAGTGLLSILCASHLGAAHTIATDGDDGVVQALHENATFNDVKGFMDIGVLRWGRALKGNWEREGAPFIRAAGFGVFVSRAEFSLFLIFSIFFNFFCGNGNDRYTTLYNKCTLHLHAALKMEGNQIRG